VPLDFWEAFGNVEARSAPGISGCNTARRRAGYAVSSAASFRKGWHIRYIASFGTRGSQVQILPLRPIRFPKLFRGLASFPPPARAPQNDPLSQLCKRGVLPDGDVEEARRALAGAGAPPGPCRCLAVFPAEIRRSCVGSSAGAGGRPAWHSHGSQGTCWGYRGRRGAPLSGRSFAKEMVAKLVCRPVHYPQTLGTGAALREGGTNRNQRAAGSLPPQNHSIPDSIQRLPLGCWRDRNERARRGV
jgi:hypothetical protein